MPLNYGNVNKPMLVVPAEKLKQLTDMIHALPMVHTVRYEAQYVSLEADKWNEFLKQVALLGVDDAKG